MSATFGLSPTQWALARDEIRAILIETASHQEMITYGSLASRLRSVQLEPNSTALATLLGEISQAEDDAGRGLLTVIVVRQDDPMPGQGFFKLAEQRGRDTADREKLWLKELSHVHATWSR